MIDTLSFVDIDGQRIELLPVRTLMSLAGTCSCGGNAGDGGHGGAGGYGGDGRGGVGVNLVNVNLLGDQYNEAGNGYGGHGGDANGGHGGSIRS